MKAKLCLWLGAALVIMFAGTVSAAPPAHYTDRQDGKSFYVYSVRYTSDGYMQRSLSANQVFDRQGNYQYSYATVEESGYSYTTSESFYRSVSCNVERDALTLNGNATIVSLSFYVSADDMSACSAWAYGVDPFVELAVNVSLGAPFQTGDETRSGKSTSPVGSYRQQCRSVWGNDYQQVAASINDQSWLPMEGDSYSYLNATSSVCNSNQVTQQ